MKKKVCVIGAGPSGLVMIKELLNKNVDVHCYESFNSVGGAFRSIEKGGRSYDSVKLTVSNYFMAYSDLMPIEGEKREYWSVAEYRDYLMRYIDKYDLLKHIHFSHQVVSSSINDGKVVVNIANKRDEFTEIFDHLVICTGSNFKPKYPDLMYKNEYEGEIIHSSEYKNANEFKDKNVVCVGLGESGADVIHEIGQVANECSVLVRDYPNVIPRYINGFTNDSFTTSFFYALKKKGIDSFMRLKSWYYLNFDKSLSEPERLIQKWIGKRKSFMGKFFTKTDVFVEDVLEGRVKLIKDEVKHFSKSGLISENRGELKADYIVFNTGYKTSFEEYTFGKDFENPRNLYKQMIHPEYGNLISIVGWARPSQGGLPACSEMQARYMALLISNDMNLPTKEKMIDAIRNDTNFYEKYFEASIKLKSLVCYHRFMTDMGKLIGCRPKLMHLKDFALTRKLIFGSHIPAFYRLQETDSRKVIKSLPIAYSKRRALVLLAFIIFYYPQSFLK